MDRTTVRIPSFGSTGHRAMEWLSALALVAIVTGVTLCVVVLLAVRALRRSLGEGVVRQAHQIKRLVEAVSVLNQQQQSAHARIQVLADANRRLGEELVALYERVGESDGTPRPSGAPRVLN
jgi:cell division protein FtsB